MNGENLTGLLSFSGLFTNVPGGVANWSFAGNTDYKPASGSVTITITQATTTTNITSSLNPSNYFQSVTFTATVTNTATAVTPTGSMQFVVDGSSFGLPVALAGSGNSVTASSQPTATLTAGSHTVTANYVNADGDFSNSSGTLSGGQTVIAVPLVKLSPLSLTFTNNVGTTSAPGTVQLTNIGAATLTFPVSGITITGPDASEFLISSNTCGTSVAYGNSGNTCTVGVEFKPTFGSSEDRAGVERAAAERGEARAGERDVLL